MVRRARLRSDAVREMLMRRNISQNNLASRLDREHGRVHVGPAVLIDEEAVDLLRRSRDLHHVLQSVKDVGYRRFRSAEALGAAFRRLHTDELRPAVARGLSASVYTQLSDVEDELNGLLTYDREVQKLPDVVVRDALARVRAALSRPGGG